jgi:cytochrome c
MIRWLASAALLVPALAMAQDGNRSGERAFQRCYSCHSVTKAEKGLTGPNLHALAQRPIAGDPNFIYSKVFKDFAQRHTRWTPELLDRFLTDPGTVVPGNQMGFFGLKDANERAAIVAYLMRDR